MCSYVCETNSFVMWDHAYNIDFVKSPCPYLFACNNLLVLLLHFDFPISSSSHSASSPLYNPPPSFLILHHPRRLCPGIAKIPLERYAQMRIHDTLSPGYMQFYTNYIIASHSSRRAQTQITSQKHLPRHDEVIHITDRSMNMAKEKDVQQKCTKQFISCNKIRIFTGLERK